MNRFLPLALLLVALAACSSPATPDGGDASLDARTDATDSPDTTDAPVPPSVAVMNLTADLTTPTAFYDIPYPSDLRLTPAGTPDLRGFPYPSGAATVTNLLPIAEDRPGFPVIPVAYFRFTGALSPQDPTILIPASGTDAPIVFFDIGTSGAVSQRIPSVAWTPPADQYLPANVLAVAARPGFVLRAGHTYAIAVMQNLGDALGRPLQPSDALSQMIAGTAPSSAALTLYQPYLQALRTSGFDLSHLVAMTVFTTGDVVAQTADLGTRVVADPRFAVTVDNLALATGDTVTSHPRFCELVGTVTYPQFQTGEPPFDTGGTFMFGSDGLPIPQTYPMHPTYAQAPISITLPRSAMPANGYPLVVYFHGSGGLSTQEVDRGTWAPESASHPCAPGSTDMWNGVSGCNTPGQGPAYILAPHGFAMAASALPVNPERLPGAADTAYLNANNLAAFRDTFRQGVLEQRMFIHALSQLHIPATLVAQCTGATLPAGATFAQFDTRRLIAQGQSMGGMYTNMISATEPTITAAIPTGAGGDWGYFILQTQLVQGAAGLLGLLLRTSTPLTFMHPGLALLETAWEPAEPMVYMPRVAFDPLPGHPVRPIYEPVGQGDSYFPTTVYDAVALAYHHRETGSVVWPTMQSALALEGLDGLITYPVMNDVTSRAGASYTGVVVQYMGDGVYDPHAIYSQLDAVKFQYACFATTWVGSGTAVVMDPTGRNADSGCM